MKGEFRRTIQNCARHEGTTWDVMRGTCGLDPLRRKTDIPTPHSAKEVDREKLRIIELSDAITTVAVDRDTDVQRNASSLCSLWGKALCPRPVKSAPRRIRGLQFLLPTDAYVESPDASRRDEEVGWISPPPLFDSPGRPRTSTYTATRLANPYAEKCSTGRH